MAQRDIIQMVLELKDKASPVLTRVGRQLEDTTEKAKKFEVSLGAVGTALKAGAAAMTAASAGFAAIGVGAIKTGAQMEAFESRLTVLLGTSEAARKRLDELFKIGSTTPFELDELVEADVIIESFGANADEMRKGIMDLAGAMGGALPDTARAVAKSFAGGMAASDGLRESYSLLFNDVKARAAAMGDPGDIQTWQKAMTAALTDVNGVVAGGTDALGQTFNGLMSNLSDAFTKFKKQIADAGLFDIAKETLREILRLIDENADAIKILAKVAAEGLGSALLGSVKLMGYMYDIALAIGAAFIDIGRAWTKTIMGIGEAANVIGLGPSDEEMSALRERLSTLDMTKEALLDMGGAATAAEDMVARIEANVAALQGAERTERGRGPRQQQQQIDIKAQEAAQKALEEQQKAFEDAAKAFGSQLESMQEALAGPKSESEKMQDALEELTASFEVAKAEAQKLATTPTEEFKKMEAEYKETAEAMTASIEKQRAAEVAHRVQQARDRLAEQAAEEAAAKQKVFDTASMRTRQVTSGITNPAAGIGALGQMGGAAGPIVAAIQGLAAIGEMGAKEIKESIKGFIDNVVVGLVEVLPDIIREVPALLIEGLTDLVEALPDIIGEVPALLIEALPDIILGALQAIPRILKALLLGLPAQVAKGSLMALVEIWRTVKAWLGEALDKLNPKRWAKDVGGGIKKAAQATASFLGFQTGGFVNKDGFYALHAGERVMPSSGASTQAMFAGAENINTGQAVTINTNVMDPNAIDGLARMLQRELGGFGGGRGLGVFNTPAASAG